MILCKATGRFSHHELGDKRNGELFWATDAQADQLEQLGLIERVEGNAIPLELYDTKVVLSSPAPAALLLDETT